ncbi:hypothetical protein [uncultured Chryseobacterium sp.]|uniref:hypothetical protein n=1 Tax=uncultured Chryseobacterium sp. TaxID=259322 RepID=UPI00258370F6|nr:hypothetical protein [uncultured Chryseobacterium sp.]
MRRVFYILLLFLFSNIFGQRLTIVNKSEGVINILYEAKLIVLNKEESKIIKGDFKKITIKKGKDFVQSIPFFLSLDEDLLLTFEENNFIKFKGSKDDLHNFIVNEQHSIFYGNLIKYQDSYYKNNIQEVKNLSELVLSNYLNKVKLLNASPLGVNDERYKKIKKYVVNDWLNSIFLFITGNKKLDSQAKELLLYYFNNYIKDNIDVYSCEFDSDYNVLSSIARYRDQLKINLPEYNIRVESEEDNINRYLPVNCQKFYFLKKYNYFNHINSPEQDVYKNILKEKFNN